MIDEVVIYRGSYDDYYYSKNINLDRAQINNLSEKDVHQMPLVSGYFKQRPLLAIGEFAKFAILTDSDDDAIKIEIHVGNCAAGRAEFLEVEEIECRAYTECRECGSSIEDPDHSDCGYECNGEVGFSDEIPDTIWLRRVSRVYQVENAYGGDLTDEQWDAICTSERELKQENRCSLPETN